MRKLLEHYLLIVLIGFAIILLDSVVFYHRYLTTEDYTIFMTVGISVAVFGGVLGIISAFIKK